MKDSKSKKGGASEKDKKLQKMVKEMKQSDKKKNKSKHDVSDKKSQKPKISIGELKDHKSNKYAPKDDKNKRNSSQGTAKDAAKIKKKSSGPGVNRKSKMIKK